MNRFYWPVVPLCKAQLKDVRPEDVLHGGLFRLCDTYRGGGGYDEFNKIYEKRTGNKINPTQFVVQLKGCPLRCDYCYVTRDGIDSKATEVSTGTLLSIYESLDVDVFHLMGGAPALYLEHWKKLAYAVEVFHSDFLLVEKTYKPEWLKGLPGLYAVSIKEGKYYTAEQLELMISNLRLLLQYDINFYITFTGDCVDTKKFLKAHLGHYIEDWYGFDIKIQHYEALDG